MRTARGRQPRPHLRLCTGPGKRGLGLSYVDGMYRSAAHGRTHICQMDADFSHDPADLPRLLAAAGARGPRDRLALRSRRPASQLAVPAGAQRVRQPLRPGDHAVAGA